jgi:hypothetical protein
MEPANQIPQANAPAVNRSPFRRWPKNKMPPIIAASITSGNAGRASTPWMIVQTA